MECILRTFFGAKAPYELKNVAKFNKRFLKLLTTWQQRKKQTGQHWIHGYFVNLDSLRKDSDRGWRPLPIHDFYIGGQRKSPGSSCMKTRSERPNFCEASLFVCNGEYLEYFKSDISYGKRYAWRFSYGRKPEKLKISELKLNEMRRSLSELTSWLWWTSVKMSIIK